MTIHIIRHAESEANTRHILAGQLDYPLSAKGMKDALAIGSWYTAHYCPKIIYCSPLLRAKQTAKPFRVEGVPFIEDKRLMEQNLGCFEGKTYTEAEDDEQYQQDRSARWSWDNKGVESYEVISKRITSFFEELDPSGPDILIVTHAVAMRLIRGLLEDTFPLYPQQLAQNGEIWEVDFKGIGAAHTITSLFIEDLNYKGHRE
jgi:broad specificity phosphatase PhoE